jgi:fructose-specific phosphotransferase system IIA component
MAVIIILGRNKKMDIHQLINTNLIITELKATSKHEMILALSYKLEENNRLLSLEGFVEDIYKREFIDSTAIGYKIAIPHAKSPHVKIPSLVFAKSSEGIDCNSTDGDLSHLFFMIAMPEEGFNTHLKVLAMISRKLMQESYRQALLDATTKEEILTLIYRID